MTQYIKMQKKSLRFLIRTFRTFILIKISSIVSEEDSLPLRVHAPYEFFYAHPQLLVDCSPDRLIREQFPSVWAWIRNHVKNYLAFLADMQAGS